MLKRITIVAAATFRNRLLRNFDCDQIRNFGRHSLDLIGAFVADEALSAEFVVEEEVEFVGGGFGIAFEETEFRGGGELLAVAEDAPGVFSTVMVRALRRLRAATTASRCRG